MIHMVKSAHAFSFSSSKVNDVPRDAPRDVPRDVSLCSMPPAYDLGLYL